MSDIGMAHSGASGDAAKANLDAFQSQLPTSLALYTFFVRIDICFCLICV